MQLVNISKVLSHLNEKQIEDLIVKYYSGDKVNDLINNYNINVTPHSFYKTLPNIKFKNKICKYCKSQIIIETRVRRINDDSLEKLKCQKCNHLLTGSCDCKNCRLERKKEDRLNRKRLLSKYSKNVKPISYKTLTLYECVFLSVYLSRYYDYKARITSPLFYQSDFYNTNIGILLEEAERMIFQLFNKNILLFYSCYFTGSYPELLKRDEIDISYMFEMRFSPNFILNSNFNTPSKYEKNNIVKKITNLNYNMLKHHSIKDFAELWQHFSLVELKSCLLNELKKFYLDCEFTIEKKGNEILKDMLRVFSTAQCYSLIFASVDIAFTKYFKNILSNEEAAFSVIYFLEEEYKRAILNKLNIPHYPIDDKRIRNEINKFFFNNILKSNSLDFIMIPNETNIKLLLENIKK